MLFNIAVFYIIIFLCFYLLGYFLHYKVTEKFLFFTFLLFAASYGIMAYHVEPPVEWDLYRHFLELDRIRSGGLWYLLRVGIYREQIGGSLLFYAVSRLPNNHFLPLVSILIEYAIFAYIVSDYCEENHLNCRYVFLILLLHFSMTDISWTISTIRQPLAMSLMALAVYLDLVKRKKWGIFFYFLGFSVHPGSVGVIVIRLAFILYKRKIPVHILLLFWSAFSSIISEWFSKSSFYWIKYIGDMLYSYVFSDNALSGDSRQVVVKLILLLLIAYMAWRKGDIWRENDYGMFLYLAFAFTIGSIASEQFFLRYVLLLSFLCFPIPKLTSFDTKRGFISLSDILYIVMFVGLIAYQYVVLTSHGVRLWFE